MSDPSSSEHARQIRLDSWKAIADYIGRSARTAQRWQKEFALPVHHLGGDSGTVFAYSEEIDQWFRNHRSRRQVSTPALPSLVQMPAKRTRTEPLIRAEIPGSLHSCSKTRSRALVADAYETWQLLAGHNLHSIARLFREAIDIDPGNPEAYAGLSHALLAQAMIGNIGLSTAIAAARAAADRALELDSGLSDANCAKAWLNMVFQRDWEAARMQFEDVLSDRPRNARARVGRALLHIAEGNCEAGSCLLYTTSQEDSLGSLALWLHAWSDYLGGAYCEAIDHIYEARQSGQTGPLLSAIEALAYAQCLPTHEAIRRIQDTIEADARNVVVCGVLGHLWGLDGEEDQARAMLSTLDNRRSHVDEPAHYALALIRVGLSEKDAAIQSIVRSYESGSLWSLGFHLDPALQRLRSEASFRQFVCRAYPDYSPKAGIRGR